MDDQSARPARSPGPARRVHRSPSDARHRGVSLTCCICRRAGAEDIRSQGEPRTARQRHACTLADKVRVRSMCQYEFVYLPLLPSGHRTTAKLQITVARSVGPCGSGSRDAEGLTTHQVHIHRKTLHRRLASTVGSFSTGYRYPAVPVLWPTRQRA